MIQRLYYNESIRKLLECIARLDTIIGPTEMICMWYDDLYFPCQNDKELYNDGVWERGQKEWRECFSNIELDVLANFHESYEKYVDYLSEDPNTFMNDPNWKKMQIAAQRALREMGDKF